jgi:hypothetical protein
MNEIIVHLAAHIGMSYLLVTMIYTMMYSIKSPSLFWTIMMTLSVGMGYEVFEQTTESYYFLDALWKNSIGILIGVANIKLWTKRN